MARQLKKLKEVSEVAQTSAEAKTAISSLWLDMVFPEEHVAPRCSWVAPVAPDPFPAVWPAPELMVHTAGKTRARVTEISKTWSLPLKIRGHARNICPTSQWLLEVMTTIH